MLPHKLIPATIMAVALVATPPDQAQADTKDVIIGAIVGGAVIAGVNAAQKRRTERERATATALRRTQVSTRPAPRVVQPKTYSGERSYTNRPSIPATAEGRELQSALNYFGFDAGTVDGRVGRKTKSASAGYQAYMGYPATGTLSAFERHVLVTSYLRAEASGTQTFAQIARLPDGPRGLLKLYRQELAASAYSPSLDPAAQTYAPQQSRALPSLVPYEL